MNTNSSQEQQVTIERMTKREVEVAVQWAEKEGWNPGIHDAECFYHADPNGFYAAKLNGEIVGTISFVRYSEDFAFDGLLIVQPDFRGRGIGLKLQRFVLDRYRGGTVGLDGMMGMQAKYEQDGFRFAHNNTRYAGKIEAKVHDRCVLIQKHNFLEVAAFDREFFFAERSTFLKCWLYQKDAASLLTLEPDTGKISGYGVIRKCTIGYKVGPLFAYKAADAEQLLTCLAQTAKGEVIFLDVPEPNAAAVDLAQKYGMQPVFSTVRMYTKTALPLPLDKIFGITSFELG